MKRRVAKVKRKLEWDSVPEAVPIVCKTTMTAVNGKPVSVRTFKLSNAMKQSLVAAGGSKDVAVAAVAAAYQANGSSIVASGHDKLSITTPSVDVALNGDDTNGLANISGTGLHPIVNHHHQSPTAIAIVSPIASKTTMATIVTTSNSPLSNGIQAQQQQQAEVFKTPWTPKMANPLNQTTPPSPTMTPQLYIVGKATASSPSKTIETFQSTAAKTAFTKSSSVGDYRLTPILANTVVKTVAPTIITNGKKKTETSVNTRKRVRTLKNETPDDPILSCFNSSNINNSKIVSGTSKTSSNQLKTSNNNCYARPRSNSINSSDDFSAYSPYSGGNSNDSFSSLADYGLSIYNHQHQPNNASSFYDSSELDDHSDFGSMSSGNGNGGNQKKSSAGRTRYETSLGQLTRKFISLLEESKDGSINLNDASSVLKVQKRRIYDITNVLEGVGLLHKTSKNNIQWRGGLFEYRTGHGQANEEHLTTHYRNRKPPPLSLLFNENQSVSSLNSSQNNSPNKKQSSNRNIEDCFSDLENDENRLNVLLKFAQDELNMLKTSSKTQPYLYASHTDLNCVPEFKNQTVIGIRPPLDTMLRVSDPSENLQIWLKNAHGKTIEVYLCSQISPENENETNNRQTSSFNKTASTSLCNKNGSNLPNIRTHEHESTFNMEESCSPMLMSNNNQLEQSSSTKNHDKINLTAIIPSSPLSGDNDPTPSISDFNNTESGYQSYSFNNGSSILTPNPNAKFSHSSLRASINGHHHQHKSLSSPVQQYSPLTTTDDGATTELATDSYLDKSVISSSSVYDDYVDSSSFIKSEPLSSPMAASSSQSHHHHHHNHNLRQQQSFSASTATTSTDNTNSYAHDFIFHDDEFGLLGSRSYDALSQTDDHNDDTDNDTNHHHHNSPTITTVNSLLHSPIGGLIPLEAPVTDDDYNFTLCENEGIAELFDNNDFDIYY